MAIELASLHQSLDSAERVIEFHRSRRGGEKAFHVPTAAPYIMSRDNLQGVVVGRQGVYIAMSLACLGGETSRLSSYNVLGIAWNSQE